MKPYRQNTIFFILILYRIVKSIVKNPVFSHEIRIKALFAILILLLEGDSTDTILENIPYAMLAISRASVEEVAPYNQLINSPLVDPFGALIKATKLHSANSNLDQLIETIETVITGLIEGYPEQFEQILNSAHNLLQLDTTRDESKAVSIAFLTTRMEEIVRNNPNIKDSQRNPIIKAIQALKKSSIPDSAHTLSAKEEPGRSTLVH